MSMQSMQTESKNRPSAPVTIKSIQDSVEVFSRTYDTGLLTPPGIDTSDAYTAGDAVGTQFQIHLPFTQGVLYSATYYDRDDEGTQMDLIISEFEWATKIADDAAMSPVDAELVKIIEVLEFASFEDFANGQISRLRNIGLAFNLDRHELWLQMETQSTPTIAAGSEPQVRLTFMGDA